MKNRLLQGREFAFVTEDIVKETLPNNVSFTVRIFSQQKATS
jgi:hypothetical protein